MGGAHRAKETPLVAAGKTVAWVLTGVGLLLILLAVLGLVGIGLYIVLGHGSHANAVTLVAASVTWVLTLSTLVERLLRGRPHSPAQTMRVIEAAWALAPFTCLLILVAGDQTGWTHGPFNGSMIAAALVILAARLAYWIRGEHRLKATLEARFAARQP